MYEVHHETIIFPTMVTVKEAAKASGLAVFRIRQLQRGQGQAYQLRQTHPHPVAKPAGLSGGR